METVAVLFFCNLQNKHAQFSAKISSIADKIKTSFNSSDKNPVHLISSHNRIAVYSACDGSLPKSCFESEVADVFFFLKKKLF